MNVHSTDDRHVLAAALEAPRRGLPAPTPGAPTPATAELPPAATAAVFSAAATAARQRQPGTEYTCLCDQPCERVLLLSDEDGGPILRIACVTQP